MGQRVFALVLLPCLLVTQRAALPHIHTQAPTHHDRCPHVHLCGDGDDHEEGEEDHDADAFDLSAVGSTGPILCAPLLVAGGVITALVTPRAVCPLPGHAVWWPLPPPACPDPAPLYHLHRALLR